MISVTLNSLVHRVPDKAELIALATEHDCQLKRIRRSRHWLLSGQEEKLRALITLLDNEAHQWIVKAIERSLPKPVFDLSAILTEKPNITLQQLVSETSCSLFEARKALDEFEGF
ncbi:hypothetical protein TW81_01510 [Vibrio galatheae]|uniref:Ribosome recycling factor n=2 Tax=Vibrio galatheae TaxID=579748 RepID=A0A0F4NPS2_9VIBR|nr:ribosome recycling factor family protein [Vibrio galatheae]KJY85112.1 hypothetical protein TW81_01510 [Vibrio galatheae]